MKNCFDVSVRLCPTCGDSGDYVDDIPSVSHNLLSSLKESDIQKFSTFFQQIKDAAYLRLKKDIEIKFNEGKKFNHIVAETSPFSVSTNHSLLPINPLGNDIIGYYTKMPYHRFVEYHINKLGFYAHVGGKVEVIVVDLVTQDILYTKELDLKRGINSVPIKHIIDNEYQRELFIGVKPISAVLSAMNCGELEDCGCDEYHTPCSCIEDCDCQEDFYGSLLPCEVYKRSNIEKESIKYFCIDASLKCNFDAMICEYSEYFQEAYKYLVALFILNHKINSYERGWYSDANTQIVIDITIPEVRDYYYQLLMLGVGNVKGLSDDSICWECSDSPKKPLMNSFV